MRGRVVGVRGCLVGWMADKVGQWNARNEKAPAASLAAGACDGCLALTYSHMGRPHTTIGDAAFHF